MSQPRVRSSVVPLGALLLPFMVTGGAEAQTVSVDEGVFHLSEDGRSIGTETFSIRQSGRGANAVTIARGRTVLDGAGESGEVTASLEAVGAQLRPSTYQVTVRGSESQRIAGRLVGRRFSARIISPAGERMREYLASDGAVLVDDGMVHHLYFVARRVDGGAARIPVIVPRRSRQVQARVSVDDPRPIRIGERRIEARRMTMETDDGAVRHIWADGRGRVLRVEIPARDFSAERAEPPQ